MGQVSFKGSTYSLDNHGFLDPPDQWSEDFALKINAFPEVMEVYRMSGEIDYMLKVVVKNARAYDDFYKRMITQIPLSDINSMFAMEEIKYTTALPI